MADGVGDILGDDGQAEREGEMLSKADAEGPRRLCPLALQRCQAPAAGASNEPKGAIEPREGMLNQRHRGFLEKL